MALASSTVSLTPSLSHFTRKTDRVDDNPPFHHLPSYITLTRTLARLSNILLPLSALLDANSRDPLTSSSDATHPTATAPDLDLTHDQRRLLRDLLSPLPYQRAKYQHTIEHVRMLLLELEQSVQVIKIQRVRRDAVQDLAEKRQVVRRLKAVVDKAGREAERRIKEEDTSVDDDDDDDGYGGETVEELLGLPLQDEEGGKLSPEMVLASGGGNGQAEATAAVPGVQEASPASEHTISTNEPRFPSTIRTDDLHSPPDTRRNAQASTQHQQEKSDLLNLRQRRQRPSPMDSSHHHHPTSTSTSISTPIPTPKTPAAAAPEEEEAHTTESLLTSDRQTQESLTGTLLSLATQLKSQSTSLSHHLMTTDKTALDRALRGLDANVSGLEAASRKMGFLRRMSEGEGWWGRILLYLWIVGLWVVVVGLVFVGPKLRF